MTQNTIYFLNLEIIFENFIIWCLIFSCECSLWLILELCASGRVAEGREEFSFHFWSGVLCIAVLAGNRETDSAKQLRAEGGTDKQRIGHRGPRPPRTVARVHVRATLQAAPDVPATGKKHTPFILCNNNFYNAPPTYSNLKFLTSEHSLKVHLSYWMYCTNLFFF